MILEGKSLLVYDAGCGPCSRFKRLVDFLDRYNRLEYLSLVEADHFGMLNRLPQNRRHRSFHLISVDGTIYSGAAAIPKLLALLPLGWIIVPFIQEVRCGQMVVSFVYDTMSRLHDTGSCSYGA